MFTKHCSTEKSSTEKSSTFLFSCSSNTNVYLPPSISTNDDVSCDCVTITDTLYINRHVSSTSISTEYTDKLSIFSPPSQQDE